MLKIDRLGFSFGTRSLFRDISFEMNAGEIVRIAGPNGSGKSTLLSLIAGLLDGAAGKITFAGDEDPRAWTAWLPADANALNPNLSAVANLQFWQDLRGLATPSSVLESTLSHWGLKGGFIQNHLPVGLFSTGMKRRLALARLDLSEARLWMLDEPLFGLDDAACKKFRERLALHLHGKGAAIVITHDERLLEGIDVSTVDLGGPL